MKQQRHELQFPNMHRNTEEDQLTSGLETSRRRLRLMKSCAELAGVEANPLEELSLLGMSDVQKETSGAACVHVDCAHEKSSNPDDHETDRSSEWTRDLETIPGSVGASEQRSVSSDADAIAAMSSHDKQRSSFGGVGTSCTTVLGTEFGHAPGHNQSRNTGAQPTGFRVVQICQTERDELAEV